MSASVGSRTSYSNPSLQEVFDTMSYGPVPDSDAVVNTWLQEHNRRFGHFINNQWQEPSGREMLESRSPARNEVLASTTNGNQEDVDTAVNAAAQAFDGWSQLPGYERSKYLYNLTRHLQKHAALLAMVESLDNGKTARETRNYDIPLMIRHFYHCAGWAQLYDKEKDEKDWEALGVVAALAPWNFPLLMLAWKVAPTLAMGNTVVFKPASDTRLSALLFAEICAEVALPPGVFNVVTCQYDIGQYLVEHPLVNKVSFTGSTEVGKTIRRSIAGSGKKLSLELGGKSPFIVFDTADLDSTIESVMDSIWFNQGEVCSSGSKLLVQESIFKIFLDKMKLRLNHFRLGDSLDKCIDSGPIIDDEKYKTIQEYVEGARSEGADIYQIDLPKGLRSGLFYPPTIITNVTTASRIVMEEVFGPIVTVIPFRTAKEAVALANNTKYGLAASVHTEKLSVALETAKMIRAGTVWINSHNLFDAASGFGGYRQSGFGRDGGEESLYEHIKPLWQQKEKPTVDAEAYKQFGINDSAEGPTLDGSMLGEGKIDHTYKLYYGGDQKRTDNTRIVRSNNGAVISLVAEANRKDVRNAVEAADRGLVAWNKMTPYNRQQVIYYIAENLSLRRNEFADRMSLFSEKGKKECAEEVDASIERLFYWAGFADKYGGCVQETQLYGTVVKLHEPVGIIGIACPSDQCPLLAFVSLFASAIARGNAVVIIPNERWPITALDMYQIFDTSDLPGGVVNVLTGTRDHLVTTLVQHQDVDAMWYFGTAEGSKFVEYYSADNVKRTWVNYGATRNWFDKEQGQGKEFLYHSTGVKNVWMPMGEIYAN